MSTRGPAHGISLPLFFFIQHFAPMPIDEMEKKLESKISDLGLSRDVQTILVIGHGLNLALEPKTGYGEMILEELVSRSEYDSCPKGECTFVGITCTKCSAIQVV